MPSWCKGRFAPVWAILIAVLILASPISAFAGLPAIAGDLQNAGPAAAGAGADLFSAKVDGELIKELSLSSTADFWVNFTEEPDLSAAATMDWSDRGWYVFDQLTEAAARSQAPAKALLDAAGIRYESYWIANSIFVQGGDMALLSNLVGMAEVSEIIADGVQTLIEPEPGNLEGLNSDIAWGVADIKAPDVWDFGVTGDGIVIGSIDSGVDFAHPALVHKYRGNLGEGLFDHDYNWHDPSSVCGDAEPCDNNGHGTHTVGTMVGDDGGSNRIGVAPGAQWIAAKGCETDTCSDAALLSSMQFMLAPTDLNGENADPDRRPHIVNNSWGGSAPDTAKQAAVQNWVAAGMFPVFANGNSGPRCGSAGSPALFPESYAVGNYTIDHDISPLSSRGPAPAPYNVTKPDISAPGTDIYSSIPGGRYAAVSGTSMAAPHVAGAIALLWSASDLLGDIETTRELLGDTAVPVDDLSCGGAAGFNNVWGRGRIDVAAAFEQVDDGDAGYVIGRVTDANDGEPVGGVAITASQDGDVVRSTRTIGDGTYRLRLLPGDYTVEASAADYGGGAADVSVAGEGSETSADFTLETALIQADLESIYFEMVEGTGGPDPVVLNLTNEGGLATDYEVSVRSSPRPRTTQVSDGGAGENSGSADKQRGGQNGFTTETPLKYDPADAGQVIKSWSTGLEWPLGVGYDGDVIISNLGLAGGDGNNHKYTVDGELITSWPTADWAAMATLDMDYDRLHNLIWQVGITASSCLFGQNPDDGTLVEEICGSPWSDGFLYGVAHRPDNDTFYVHTWDPERIIYHIAGLSWDDPGQVLEQYEFDLGGHPTWGLAWNDTAKVLWMATNSEEDKMYALKPDEDWAEVAVLDHPEPGYGGGGLDIDENGNLWIVSSISGTAYLVNSGIPATPVEHPWLESDVEGGSLAPEEQASVELSTANTSSLAPGRYEGSVTVTSRSGRHPRVTVPVTLRILMDNAGWVEGVVTDENDGLPVAGATVTAKDSGGATVNEATADENGYYRFQLYLGEYSLEATAKNYGIHTKAVTVEEVDGEQTVGFAIPTALPEADPDALEFSLNQGETETKFFTLNNSGTGDMNWTIKTRRGTAADAGFSEPFGRIGLTRNPDYDENAMTTAGMYLNGTPADEPGEAPVVLDSWATGLAIPWGVGFDEGLIFSNPAAGGGDDHNYKMTEGGDFITKWSTAAWHGAWAADITYDSKHDILWQVAVEADNCLYGMDPHDGTVLDKICGRPWTDASQRGVAYRPDTDTFYLGGWNEDIVYHIKGLSYDNPGELIEQRSYAGREMNISGLAWNDTAKVLWIATNSVYDNVYAVTPDDGWETIKVIAHPEGGPLRGGGLSLDDRGNLWMVSQLTRIAYLVESGIYGKGGVPWLDTDTYEGTVAAGDSVDVEVIVDASDLEVGTHEAYLLIETDGGRVREATVEITARVHMGPAAFLKGVITDANDGGPVAGARIEAVRTDGTRTITGTPDGDGSYELHLHLGEYEVTVTADNYSGATVTVDLTEEDAQYEEDFVLETPQLEVGPGSLEFYVPLGGTAAGEVTVKNTGGREMAWRLGLVEEQDESTGSSVHGHLDLERNPSYDPDGVTPAGMYVNEPGVHRAPRATVLKSWTTDFGGPWGVGFDGSVILSSNGPGGGDNHNYKLTVDGEFITKWSTAEWQGNFAGDMTYDSSHHLIWQVNVGGDNCLHGMDPDDGTEQAVICRQPWVNISQRGVAYRPDDDTMYLAGWNQNIIYRIKGLSHDNPGEVIEEHPFSPGGRGIAGLGWNPTEKILWVTTSSSDDNIYALAPEDGWAQVAVIGHPEGSFLRGAGISVDYDGNLWIASPVTRTVYLLDGGIPAKRLGWLQVDSQKGTIEPGGSQTIAVSADSRDLDPGTYRGELRLSTNSGRGPKLGVIDVVMNVMTPPELTITDPEDGYLTNREVVTVTGTAADDFGIESVFIDGRRVSVGADGSFSGRALLDEGSNTIAVTAVNVGGLETTATVTVMADWTDPVLVNISPAEDVVLQWGEGLEISFTSEPGLTAAYQVILNGTASAGGGEGILVRGVPFEEGEDGLYKASYVAPEANFDLAHIQINAMDAAGNKIHVMAPGRITVIPEPDPAGPPTLTVTEPEDGLLTNRGAIRISGSATDEQPGQSVESVTVNGRSVAVEADGAFTTRIALTEGANVITVTAINTAGETATEIVTVTADWTPPEPVEMEPAAEVVLSAGESYTVRFTGEPGLTAAFQVLIGGQRGKWYSKDVPVRGVAMVEVESGVYEGVYTAPPGTTFTMGIVQFNVSDAAGNVTMVTAPGGITVVK